VILSLMLWGALMLVLAGIVVLIRKRRPWILLIALALIGVALLWPASLQQTSSSASDLDRIMPRWQFDERHSIHVDAPPARVYAAIRAVTADDIRFFRTLTAIRRFGRPLPPGILNANNEPILDLATRTSFRWLANDPPGELVVGTRIAPRTLAAMNFLVTPDARGGSNVSTETRVHAATGPDARAFAVYWRIIRPGSDIIRRSWLRAIKRRAEGGG
jgi:hypothetical protein